MIRVHRIVFFLSDIPIILNTDRQRDIVKEDLQVADFSLIPGHPLLLIAMLYRLWQKGIVPSNPQLKILFFSRREVEILSNKFASFSSFFSTVIHLQQTL